MVAAGAGNGSCYDRSGEGTLKRAILSLLVALLIVASYAVPVGFGAAGAVHAQFSDPQQDIPAFHPEAPEKGQVLPPILSGNQLTGQFFREKWQVEVYKEAAQIAAAIERWDTRVCTAASRGRTGRFARRALRKARMPTR